MNLLLWWRGVRERSRFRAASNGLECPECKHRFDSHSDKGHGIIRKRHLPCRCNLYRSELDEYAKRNRLLDPRCQSLIGMRGECAKVPHGLPYTEAFKHKPGCDFFGCTDSGGWCRRRSDGSVLHRCWKGQAQNASA